MILTAIFFYTTKTQRHKEKLFDFVSLCLCGEDGLTLRRATKGITLFIFTFLSLHLLACESGPPPEMTDPGALIYYGYFKQDAQCSRCHGDEGQGGMFGPQIRDVMQKRSIERVRDIIANGEGEGDKKMPDFANELTPAQIEQVIRFLQTWNITAPADSMP